MSLGKRLVFATSAILVVVLGLTAAVVIQRTGSMMRAETLRASESLAEVVGDSIKTFGETGDMEGLEMFLASVGGRESLGEVHAVRAPSVVEMAGEREGSEPKDALERQVLASGKAFSSFDATAHRMRLIMPLLADNDCIACHTSVTEGDVLGVVSVAVRTEKADAELSSFYKTVSAIFVAVMAVTSTFLWLVIKRTATRPIERIAARLYEGADQVSQAAQQVSSASQELADGASEQASSLEETSSALEQMAAMTRTSAENAKQANELSDQARRAAENGSSTMKQLNVAMDKIDKSSSQISQIIKVIEEIAFQTNLLALNAAVEAARAGEHGKGFAVVADEVRNLAQRAAHAAQETTGLIEDSAQRTREGTCVAEEVGSALATIVADISKVTELVDGIARSSEEQAQGVEQVNIAVSQMDRVTQQNAAGSEESASAAEQLSAQSRTVKSMVDGLGELVSGSKGRGGGVR